MKISLLLSSSPPLFPPFLPFVIHLVTEPWLDRKWIQASHYFHLFPLMWPFKYFTTKISGLLLGTSLDPLEVLHNSVCIGHSPPGAQAGVGGQGSLASRLNLVLFVWGLSWKTWRLSLWSSEGLSAHKLSSWCWWMLEQLYVIFSHRPVCTF